MRLVSCFVGRRLLLLLSYVHCHREWKLALGSGSWVGGIDIETFDELCFEKIYVSKSLNPKP